GHLSLHQRLETKAATLVVRNKIDGTRYVLVKRALQDPINALPADISYGSSDAAHAAPGNLKKQAAPILPSRLIPDEEYLRKSLMHRSKRSRVEAGEKFYKARSDYAVLSRNQNAVNAIAEKQSKNEHAIQADTVVSTECEN